MTLKMKLRRLRRLALNKQSRTKEEKKLINEFIVKRLEKAANEGEKSAKFGINHISEKIVDPKNNNEIIVRMSDYIKFAIKHFMRIKIVTDISFISQNYVQIFY